MLEDVFAIFFILLRGALNWGWNFSVAPNITRETPNTSSHEVFVCVLLCGPTHQTTLYLIVKNDYWNSYVRW